jgi:hypothetical protein
MVRLIALVGVATVLAAPLAAFAAAPSGYGTEGPYGRRLHHQAQTTFDREWNHWNESKNRAEESARWMRQHGYRNPF